MDYNFAAVKELLERALKAQGIPKKELCARLRAAGVKKVSETLVSHWTTEKRKINPDVVAPLVKTLALSDSEARALYQAIGIPFMEERNVEPVHRYLPAIRDILKNRFSRLSKDVERMEKLIQMTTSVISDWRNKEDKLPPWAPSRGPEHNFQMMKRLAEYLTSDELDALNVHEQFLLVAVIWLHDIGIAFASDGSSQLAVHEKFHLESQVRIRSHHFEYQLDKEEADVIINLCQRYREIRQLASLEISEASSPVNASRQRLLLAYLQLADILDARPERLENRHYFATATQSEVVSSWLFNLFIQQFDRENHKVVAYVNYSADWGQSRIADLFSTVAKHLQGRLNHLKDILVAEGHCNLLTVEIKLGSQPDSQRNARMRQFLNALGTFRSPNARRVFHALLDNMERIDSMASLKDFADNLIPAAIRLHPFHGRVRNLQDSIREALSSHETDAKKLQRTRELWDRFSKQLGLIDDKIADLLSQELGPDSCVVLMGYSDSVFNALRLQREELKTSIHVVVLECRNKSVYDLDNALEYCDGAENAVAIKGVGYRNVWLATDASIASLFRSDLLSSKQRHLEVNQNSPRRPTAVLLGINTVIGAGGYSTAGYLTVTSVAKAFDIPIYVLTETEKIRRDDDSAPRQASEVDGGRLGGGEERIRTERANRWLPEDDLVGTKLRRAGVELFNPVDDYIPEEHISFFLTEKGKYAPKALKEMSKKSHR